MRSKAKPNISYSTNWSGFGGTGTNIEGAEGAWTVPAIRPSSSAKYSSSWVGVDGETNSDLIQTGTEQDTTDGYYAWIEILPADESVIVDSNGDPATVEPGDSITASVFETSNEVWTIYLADETQDWYFENSFSYYGPGASAEWVEEAPTVNGEQSTPANFGTADFSETAIYGNFGSGLGWYGTDMGASNEIAMVNQSDTRILAMPSAPSKASSTGQSFTDTYVTSPSPPTNLRATAEVKAAKITWSAPHNDGGTAIVGYDVREYRAGSLIRTSYVPGTVTTVKGLTPGTGYAYSVAALSFGNYTSSYTDKSRTIHPTK